MIADKYSLGNVMIFKGNWQVSKKDGFALFTTTY